MLKLFQDALESPAGSFAFVFAILAICFLAVWKISHFTTKFNSVERLETSIGQIKEEIHYIKASIQVIKDSTNPLAQRNSPVSMTIKGEEVAKELKLINLITNHWEFIYSQLNETLSEECNPYDIQVESFRLGEKYQDILTSEELKIIKSHAYKAGFNLEVYNLLFGIIIRDKYLSDRGFKIDDVDLYDPIKKTT